MTNKKKKTAATAAIVSVALLFAGSFAWVSTLQTATNEFVQEDYDVKLHDVFDGVTVEDGKSHKVKWTDDKKRVDKQIWVTNNGSDDVLVRVKLTENMKINNNGKETVIGTANAAHVVKGTSPVFGDDCKAIHDHVTWTTPASIKTFEEWSALDETAKSGAYWVITSDGWAYWMQPLKPADPTQDAVHDAVGNTGLLLEAVTLKDGESGHIDYSIKAEMDAIDATLEGLPVTREDGTGWDLSLTAKQLAVYSSGKLATLRDKKEHASSSGAQILYQQAIDNLLDGKFKAALRFEAQGDSNEEEYINNKAELDTKVTLTGEGGILEDTELARAITDIIGRTDNITKNDLCAVGELDLKNYGNITNISGLTVENFPNLTSLFLTNNQNLDENAIKGLDTGLKQQLVRLGFSGVSNVSGSLDFAEFTSLKNLYLDKTKITELTNLPATMEVMFIGNSQLTGDLDVTGLNNLVTLSVSHTNMTGIVGSEDLTGLEFLDTSYTKLVSINVPNSKKLCWLDACATPTLTEINLTNEEIVNDAAHVHGPQDDRTSAPNFVIWGCSSLTSIDISKIKAIKSVSLSGCTSMTTATRRKADQQFTKIPQNVTVEEIGS